jgi:hypothetical protein
MRAIATNKRHDDFTGKTKVINMTWAPEPNPRLVMTSRSRYRIRRTACGYAIYDHALGELVSLHRNIAEAVYQKRRHRKNAKNAKKE